MTNKQKGIGLESEGFFLDSEGNSVAMVEVEGEMIPTSEHVLAEMASRYPKVISFISPELVSVTLEVKSDVCADFPEAIAQIFLYKKLINEITTEKGFNYEFVPVLEKPYQAIPSLSSSTRHVSEQLVPTKHRERIWNVLTEFGYAQAYSDPEHYFHESTISSLQINDSRFISDESGKICYESLVRIYNLLLDEKNTLLSFNKQIKNYQQKERIECYIDFLTHLKQEQFEKRGYAAEEIVFPKTFRHQKQLLQYFAAHADKDTFDEHIDSKNINGFMKFKPEIRATELRIIDSQNTPEDVLKVCNSYDQTVSSGMTPADTTNVRSSTFIA